MFIVFLFCMGNNLPQNRLFFNRKKEQGQKNPVFFLFLICVFPDLLYIVNEHCFLTTT